MNKTADTHPYRAADWKKFREEVIRLDGGICQHCLKGREHGKVLQVHHRYYVSGKAPWEYPHDACMTLCQGCHAQEHGKIRPSSGWEFHGYDDLGGLYGNCELCNTEIRYVFFVSHPNWRALEVGTDCCDKLMASDVASQHQLEMVRHARRLKTFVSSGAWKQDFCGHWHIRRKRLDISIRKDGRGYLIQIEHMPGGKRFESFLDAKVWLFEGLENGSIERHYYMHQFDHLRKEYR